MRLRFNVKLKGEWAIRSKMFPRTSRLPLYPRRNRCSCLFDKDIAEWLRKQGDIVREVNGLCRFYMETCISREFEFDVEAFEAAQAAPQSGKSR
jgi:hypothetical protein